MINALADELTDLSAANYAKKGIANFEKLVISDVTTNDALDFVTPATGFKDITLAGGQGADNTFTVYDGTTLTLGESGSATNDTATVTVSGAAGAGRNSDTFTLKLAADASGGSIAFGEMNVANVETINIESTIKASTTNASSNDNDVDLVIANAKTVTVTGDTGLLLSGDAFDGVIETFDASGLTGNINVSFAGGAGVTYTASNGVNVMVGSSNADLINGSASGDTITGGDGIDVITLGAAGKVDTVKMGGIIATANRDTIKGFDATGTNKDVIQVTATDTAVATNATDAPVQQTVSALAASTTAADVDFVEFAFEAAVDLTSSSTGTTFLKAISNTSSAASLTVDAEGDELYAIAYQGGDAFLFYIQDATASDSDTGAVQNDEIFLVATIEGVAVGALTMANFDLA
jgi:S-layer protein